MSGHVTLMGVEEFETAVARFANAANSLALTAQQLDFAMNQQLINQWNDWLNRFEAILAEHRDRMALALVKPEPTTAAGQGAHQQSRPYPDF